MTATNPPYSPDPRTSTPPQGAVPPVGPGPFVPTQQSYGRIPHGQLYDGRHHYGQEHYGPRYAAPARPGTVLAGAVLTYVGAGLQIAFGLIVTLASLNADFVRGFGRGFGTSLDAGVVIGFGVFCVLLGAALVTLAALTTRGRNGARVALSVIGGVVALLQVVSIVTGTFASVVTLAWVVTAVVLLWVGRANAWFASTKR